MKDPFFPFDPAILKVIDDYERIQRAFGKEGDHLQRYIDSVQPQLSLAQEVERSWPLLQTAQFQHDFSQQVRLIADAVADLPINEIARKLGKFSKFVPTFSQPAIEAIRQAASLHEDLVNTFVGSAINDIRLAAATGLSFDDTWEVVRGKLEERADSVEKTWINQYGLQVLVFVLAVILSLYLSAQQAEQLELVETNLKERITVAETRIIERMEQQSTKLLAKIQKMINAKTPDLILVVSEEAPIFVSPSDEERPIATVSGFETLVPVVGGDLDTNPGWVQVHFFDHVHAESKKGWIQRDFVEEVDIAELEERLEREDNERDK